MPSTKQEKEVKIEKVEVEIKGDGKKAHLPHPIFQNCLFVASRHRHENEYRKRKIEIVRKNKWGDTITIRSAKTLFTQPDMGVFLGTVALIQKYGFERLVGASSGYVSNRLISHFPIRDLYEITRATKGKKQKMIHTSLEALGSVSISIRYADPEKHSGRKQVSLMSFWDLDIEKRKGRGGSIVHIYPAYYLIPREHYLFADAEICNLIRSDTARGIFWALISREHMTGSLLEWRHLLNPEATDPRIDIWRDRRFLPALEELSQYGYVVKEDGDTYTVIRPSRTKKLEKRVTSSTKKRGTSSPKKGHFQHKKGALPAQKRGTSSTKMPSKPAW